MNVWRDLPTHTLGPGAVLRSVGDRADYFLIFTPLVVNRCGRCSGRTGRRVVAALPVPGG